MLIQIRGRIIVAEHARGFDAFEDRLGIDELFEDHIVFRKTSTKRSGLETRMFCCDNVERRTEWTIDASSLISEDDSLDDPLAIAGEMLHNQVFSTWSGPVISRPSKSGQAQEIDSLIVSEPAPYQDMLDYLRIAEYNRPLASDSNRAKEVPPNTFVYKLSHGVVWAFHGSTTNFAKISEYNSEANPTQINFSGHSQHGKQLELSSTLIEYGSDGALSELPSPTEDDYFGMSISMRYRGASENQLIRIVFRVNVNTSSPFVERYD